MQPLIARMPHGITHCSGVYTHTEWASVLLVRLFGQYEGVRVQDERQAKFPRFSRMISFHTF